MKQGENSLDVTQLKQHVHIVFGFEHYNPLGLVRSLGENGVKPVVVVVNSQVPLTSKSKFVGVLHKVKTIEDGYKLILSKYSNLPNKPFIYVSDDQTVNFLDARYDEIKDKFFFFNAGAANRIAEYQNKAKILQLAQKHGIGVLDLNFSQ